MYYNVELMKPGFKRFWSRTVMGNKSYDGAKEEVSEETIQVPAE
jgi:hypothetical protein